MQQENGRCDVRAVRVAQRQGLSDAIGAARLTDEIGELTRPAAHIILVEQTLAKASEEARHIAFEHVAARREERRPRRNRATKRDKIGFVAARSMKQEKRRTAWVGAGLEAMNIGQLGRHHRLPRSIGRCKVRLMGYSSFGSAASIAGRRPSRNGGSLSASPSESGDSSTAKPGGSVAISNNTRPGSRK